MTALASLRLRWAPQYDGLEYGGELAGGALAALRRLAVDGVQPAAPYEELADVPEALLADLVGGAAATLRSLELDPFRDVAPRVRDCLARCASLRR